MDSASMSCLVEGHAWSRAPFWKSIGWGFFTIVGVTLIFGLTPIPSAVLVLLAVNNGMWAIMFAALLYERRGVPCSRCGAVWHKP